MRSAHVDERYFATLGITLVRGRAFRSTDTEGAPRVAVVNETFAAHYWPGQEAGGRRFRVATGDRPWVEIVGVAATHKYRALSEGPTEFIYYASQQDPVVTNTILVATERQPSALAAPVCDAVRALDPDMLFDVRSLDSETGIDRSTTYTRT